MSIFRTEAPQKAVRNGGSVTPMSGPQYETQPKPVNPAPPGDIKHAPNAGSK